MASVKLVVGRLVEWYQYRIYSNTSRARVRLLIEGGLIRGRQRTYGRCESELGPVCDCMTLLCIHLPDIISLMVITTLSSMMIGITLLLCLSDGLEVIMVYTLHVRHLLDISPVDFPFFFCPPFLSSCFAPILVCVIITIIL